MIKGIVKWFNNKSKYGFILTPEGQEVFVHFSEINEPGYKTLKRGELVQFDLEQTERGLRALHVEKMDEINSTTNRIKKFLDSHERYGESH